VLVPTCSVSLVWSMSATVGFEQLEWKDSWPEKGEGRREEYGVVGTGNTIYSAISL